MCRGWRCGFPEETGEEQEILLSPGKEGVEPSLRGVCCGMNCFQIEHIQCEIFFLKIVQMFISSKHCIWGELWKQIMLGRRFRTMINVVFVLHVSECLLTAGLE